MALLGRNRHYQMDTVRRHFNSTARHVGLGANAEALIEGIVAATPDVIAGVQRELPSGFSQKVPDSVLGGLEHTAAQR
ncbi:MAG: hypothetical protein J0I65_14680 [Variovorax sp.]|nr:hypothetical protein [Variovorax sp.]